MTQNLCTPSNIYGSFQQTLFCGCSVLDFNLTLGFGDVATELLVNVAQDPCSSTASNSKIYYDSQLNQQTTTDPDPGFTYPDIGSPAYFRINDFEFCGIIASWSERNDSSGKPIFSVRLQDPRNILDNMQVILEEYAGTTSNVYNLINVYGWLESLEGDCPPITVNGVEFGSPAGGFGFANVNARGIPWNKVKGALSALLGNSTPLINNYSTTGRLTYIGAQPGKDGYGVIEADDVNFAISTNFLNANPYLAYYILDISEIPFSSDYYRVIGPNISLLELIGQVCQDAGCDFYIELLPVKISGLIYKIIKVRVVSRRSQPVVGSIQTYINANSALGIQQNSIGQELRNDPTSVFLFGGKKQYVYEQTASGYITPYWGTDSYGNLNYAYQSGDQWYVRLDVNKLNSQLNIPITGSTYITVSENELRIAAAGDKENLIRYALVSGTDLGSYFANRLNLEVAFRTLNLLPSDYLPLPGELLNAGAYSALTDPLTSSEQDKNVVTTYIQNYSTEFYGKQFLAQIPFVCYEYDTESQSYFWSDEPSTDGGWHDFNTLLSLPFPSTITDFFTDDKGKVQPIVRYYATGSLADQYGIDLSRLSTDDFIGFSGNISGTDTTLITTDTWIKSDIDQSWVIGLHDGSNPSAVSALIKLPAPVYTLAGYKYSKKADIYYPENADLLLARLTDIGLSANSGITNEFMDVNINAVNKLADPVGIAIPIISNTRNYGPWGVSGPPGPVRVDQDEGLVPWEYGSADIMDTAALARVSDAVTYMRVSERGSITVAGYPDIPLGAELGAIDANYLAGQHLLESRIITTNTFDAYSYYIVNMGIWEGIYGPNINSINVQVSQQGISTTYEFSTYVQPPDREGKKTHDRIKKIGEQRLKYIRDVRANIGKLAKANIKVASAKNAQKIYEAIATAARKEGTEHSIVVAAPPTTGMSSRTDVAHISINKLTDAHTSAQYAAASQDMFYRPVSISGLYSLPQLIQSTIDTVKKYQRSPILSYYISTTGSGGGFSSTGNPALTGLADLSISRHYLNPVENPSGILSQRSVANTGTGIYDIPYSGHDILVLGRNNLANFSVSIPATEAAGKTGYASDYAFPAIKGPIVMQSWGYDIDGKPVPNSADIDAENGIFSTTGLTDQFKEGWLQRPQSWPVAPIDFRLDKERGVWTCAPANPNIEVDLVINAPPQTNNLTGTLVYGNVYDSGGVAISTGIVVFNNQYDSYIPSGARVTLYWDYYNDVYKLLNQFRASDISARADDTLTSSPTDIWASSQSITGTVLHEDSNGFNFGVSRQIELINPHNMFGLSSGTIVLAKWDGSTPNGYIIYQKVC